MRPDSPSHHISVARIYGHIPNPDGHSVLVDRLWPRGLSRDNAPFDAWLKDVAPSTELRRWYGHVPDRYADFADRYRQELDDDPARLALERLRTLATKRDLVLLTATKDTEHSAAAVLQDLLIKASLSPAS